MVKEHKCPKCGQKFNIMFMMLFDSGITIACGKCGTEIPNKKEEE